MLPVIRHRAGRIAAVTLALAAWLGGGVYLHQLEPEQRLWAHLNGIAVFFLLAVFLPEERKARSLGRKGALQMMAFTVWLLTTDWVVNHKDAHSPEAGLALVLGVPVLAYFMGLFMIRGFRATPDYEVEAEPEKKASPAEDKSALEVSDETRVASLMGRLEESPAEGSK